MTSRKSTPLWGYLVQKNLSLLFQASEDFINLLSSITRYIVEASILVKFHLHILSLLHYKTVITQS